MAATFSGAVARFCRVVREVVGFLTGFLAGFAASSKGFRWIHTSEGLCQNLLGCLCGCKAIEVYMYMYIYKQKRQREREREIYIYMYIYIYIYVYMYALFKIEGFRVSLPNLQPPPASARSRKSQGTPFDC